MKAKISQMSKKTNYSNLVNLETYNPDFFRNSIADSSVIFICFSDCGFLNVS